jgi:hypothetical protein
MAKKQSKASAKAKRKVPAKVQAIVAKNRKAKEGRIVSGAGTAASVGGPDGGTLSKALEEAMSKAVLDAMEEGLSPEKDAKEIRKRKEAARDRVKTEYVW